MKSIDKKFIFLCFVMIPFLKPYNVTLIAALDLIFKVWKVISTLIILIWFIKKRPHLHSSSIALLAFLSVWTVSLVLNSGPISDYGNNILSVVAMVLLFETNYNNEKFKYNISKFFYWIAVIYMFLNLITVVIGYPFLAGGMQLGDNANFLGGDNYSAFILIVLCGFMFFYDVKQFGVIRTMTWLVSLVGLLCLLIPFSFAGIIAYGLFLLAVWFNKNGFSRQMFKWKYALIICVLVFVFVAYANSFDAVDGLLEIIGKAGFNGRNMIWPMAFSAFLKKPLLGYGGVTEELAKTWIIAGANHTHNLIMEYPFSTGIIGTSLFLLYLYFVFSKVSTRDNKSLKILLLALNSYILCGIFDFYIGLIYFYLLLLMIWQNKKV